MRRAIPYLIFAVLTIALIGWRIMAASPGPICIATALRLGGGDCP
jgi:hypothetical protein